MYIQKLLGRRSVAATLRARRPGKGLSSERSFRGSPTSGGALPGERSFHRRHDFGAAPLDGPTGLLATRPAGLPGPTSCPVNLAAPSSWLPRRSRRSAEPVERPCRLNGRRPLPITGLAWRLGAYGRSRPAAASGPEAAPDQKRGAAPVLARSGARPPRPPSGSVFGPPSDRAEEGGPPPVQEVFFGTTKIFARPPRGPVPVRLLAHRRPAETTGDDDPPRPLLGPPSDRAEEGGPP